MKALDRIMKHVGVLCSSERLSLINDAAIKGNDLEWRRLMDSAPRYQWSLPDHQGSALGRKEAAHVHITTVLELLCQHWQAEAFFCEAMNDKESAICGQIAELTSYEIAVHVEAWKQFCRDLAIDPVAGIECLSSFVAHSEMPGTEHTAETIVAACPLLFTDPDQRPFTVADILKTYHGLVAYHEEQWAQTKS